MSREAWEDDIRAHETKAVIVELDPAALTPEQARALEGWIALGRRFKSVGRIRPLGLADVLPEPFNLDEMAAQQEAA